MLVVIVLAIVVWIREIKVSNCSPRMCAIMVCNGNYKINSDGQRCVPKDDTCPANYFKTCTETSIETTITPKNTEAGTACYKCKPKEPATCQQYVSDNKISGIIYNSYSTTSIYGTLKGPRSINYAQCKMMAMPVITVTQPLSYAYVNADSVNIKFTTPNSLEDEECKRMLPNCKEQAGRNNGYGSAEDTFKDCMRSFVPEGISCSYYDNYSCCLRTVYYDADISNLTLKNAIIDAPKGMTTGKSYGRVDIEGSSRVNGTISSYAAGQNGYGMTYGGNINTKTGANAYITQTECYLGTLTVEAGATLTTSMRNNYQGGREKNSGMGVQVYGTMNASSFSFVNGPATIHGSGFLNIKTLYSSGQYKGRIYYKSGAKLQIGSTCRQTFSDGYVDFESNLTSPPSNFGSYCSPVSF